MPIYEYKCAACGHAFDYLARTLADKPEKCPACAGRSIAKQFSTFAPAVATPGACDSCVSAPSCPASRMGGCGAC